MWKEALGVFLQKWKDHEEFEGAIVSGSFVTNDQVEKSDIDLHIIMSDKFHRKEKGICHEAGFLISYSAYPQHVFALALKQGREEHERITARFFAKGTILEDKNGLVQKLKAEAERDLSFPLTKLSEPLCEQAKYIIFSVLEDLEKITDDEKYYCFVYYLLLEQIIRSYAMFLGVDIPNTVRSYAKLPRFFHDKAWCKKYLINDWPDPMFVDLFESALETIDPDLAHELADYVLDAMGGFDHDTWKLVTPV